MDILQRARRLPSRADPLQTTTRIPRVLTNIRKDHFELHTQHSTVAYSNTAKGTAHCLYSGLTNISGTLLTSRFVATVRIDLGA